MSLTASTASRSAVTLSSSQRPSAEGVLDLLAEALAQSSAFAGPFACRFAATGASVAGFGLVRAEGLEQLALVPRQPRWHAHVDTHVEVATCARPAQLGD